MSDTRDNVISFQTRLHEPPPIAIPPRDWGVPQCNHSHTILETTTRSVTCSDCKTERLDIFDVLMKLADQWDRWQRQAKKLETLNAEYHQNQREKWDRRRDRHLNPHPDHRPLFDAVIGKLEDPSNKYRGTSRDEFACDTCWNIFNHYDHRWTVRKAPESPSGALVSPFSDRETTND